MGDVTTINVPVAWLGPGRVMPAGCARHGEPPVTYLPIQPATRLPGWFYLLIPAGFLPFIVALAVWPRQRAIVPGWPLCPRCMARRRSMITGGVFALLVPMAGAVGVIATIDEETQPVLYDVATVIGSIVLLAALALAVRLGAKGSPTGLAGASVSRDGQWIAFRDPHPGFVAQLRHAVPTATVETT